MTVVEALRISKETGKTFWRSGSKWVKWDPNWTYRFTGEELLANDWEDVNTFIPKLTGGRWSPAK